MGRESTGRGMVLEVRGRSALVLADGGEFRWVPLKGQRGGLGGEVQVLRRQSLALRPLLRPALAMAALVTLMLMVPRLGAPGPIAARISLDINPSFELAVDARERVVETVGVDGSGRQLVRAAGTVRGRDLGAVLERLLRAAYEHRYLDPAGPNVVVLAVTSFLPGQERVAGGIEALGERVKMAAGRELTGAGGITLASLQVSQAVWQEARAVGLSAGRFAVLLRAQERGLKLEVEDVRQGRLGEAIGKAGGLAEEVMAGDDPPGVLEDLAEKFRERNRTRRPGRDPGKDEEKDDEDERPEDEDGDERHERPGRPDDEVNGEDEREQGGAEEGEGRKQDVQRPGGAGDPGEEIDERGPPARPGRDREDRPQPPGRGRRGPGEREEEGEDRGGDEDDKDKENKGMKR